MIEGQFKPLQKLQFEQFEDFTVGGLEISYFGAAESSASTITWPAGVIGGDRDIAVLFDAARSGSLPTEVIPSGFTKITGANNGSSSRGTVSYKILTGSESGSLTGQNGSTQNAKGMVIFRASRAIVGVTLSTPNVAVNNGNPAAQNVVATGEPAPLIVLGQAAADNAASFSTQTPAFGATVVTGGGNQIIGYTIYNTSPANQTVDMNDLGAFNFLTSFYVRFT